MENKKMTLRLQWYDLTASEAKHLSAQLEEMAKDVFYGERKCFRLPWKYEKNLRVQKKWEEKQLLVRRKYCHNGLYSLYCSISHPSQNVLDKYNAYLKDFYTKTNLFTGYLLYEPHHLGIHGYYHLFPATIPAYFEEERWLVGYEWSAYLSSYLAEQLRDDEIAELESYAEVIRINGGIFYQSKCPITAFGEKEKKAYKRIFQTILKPGFQCVPLSATLLKTMCPSMENAYLLKATQNASLPEHIGFFYKTKPEDTPLYEVFDSIGKISEKDDV